MVHGRHEEIAHRVKHMTMGLVREEAEEETKENAEER